MDVTVGFSATVVRFGVGERGCGTVEAEDGACPTEAAFKENADPEASIGRKLSGRERGGCPGTSAAADNGAAEVLPPVLGGIVRDGVRSDDMERGW